MRRVGKNLSKFAQHGQYFFQQAAVAPAEMTEDKDADPDHDSDAEEQSDPQFQVCITEDDPEDVPLYQKCQARVLKKFGLEPVPNETEAALYERIAALNVPVRVVPPSDEDIERALPLEGKVALNCEKLVCEMHAAGLITFPPHEKNAKGGTWWMLGDLVGYDTGTLGVHPPEVAPEDAPVVIHRGHNGVVPVDSTASPDVSPPPEVIAKTTKSEKREREISTALKAVPGLSSEARETIMRTHVMMRSELFTKKRELAESRRKEIACKKVVVQTQDDLEASIKSTRAANEEIGILRQRIVGLEFEVNSLREELRTERERFVSPCWRSIGFPWRRFSRSSCSVTSPNFAQATPAEGRG